ncbi:MAG TPA: ABC transporter substrate-binding protein [Atribacteraceae bacterium]|nr:ABC transporter substrate-binding protein [Atribacteraceae bacterium]
MKKFAMFLLSGLLLFGVFSGMALAQGITLDVWMMVQADVDLLRAQEEALEDFKAIYPDIDVQFTVFPYVEYRDKLLIAAMAGNPPDVAVVDQIWNPEFSSAGFIIPLDDYVAASETVNEDAFFSGAWDSALYKGRLYGIPFDVGVWALNYYNKDHFRAAGLDPEVPPVTWDDFYEYATKLTRDTSGDGIIDQWGTALFVGTGDAIQCITNALKFSNSGSVLNEDFTRAVLNEPAGVEAMEFFKSLQAVNPAGEVARSEEDSFMLFTAGSVSMFWYGEWGQSTVKARAPEMDWGLGNFPKAEGKTSIGTFGGWNMVIFEQTPYKDAAWKFIEHWTSREVNEKVASLTPANKEAAVSFLTERRLFPDVILRQLTTALYRPIFPRYPDLAEVQRSATTAILLGQKTVQQALDDAAREIDQLLDEYYAERL